MAEERIVVSLRPETAAALQKLVDGGRIESVDDYVTEAVEDRLGRQERAERVIKNMAAEAQRQDPEQWEQALRRARSTAHKDERAKGAA